MRKALIVIFGLASLGALVGVQPASASQACVQIALNQCNASGGKCTTSTQYLGLYRQCLNDEGARAAASKQQKQSYINNAQTPTGILGGGRGKQQAK